MRLIHNFLNLFRKDSGAHFTYNIGVGFMRTALFLIILELVAFLLISWAPWVQLKKVSAVEATADRVWIEEHTVSYSHSRYRSRQRTYYDYFVRFSAKYPDGTAFVKEVEIDRKLYDEYKQYEGLSGEYNLYRSKDDLYISRKSRFPATLEYRRLVMKNARDLSLAVFLYGVPAIFVIIAIGAGQMRLAMKYPRTDVDIGETDLVVQAEREELMREFDKAYEEFQRKKAAGLPTSTPERTDQKRLEDRGKYGGHDDL